MESGSALTGKRIAVMVTGSIAAYKGAELVRHLVKLGASVQVVMTKRATEFITPLTMQTLSGRPVYTDPFDCADELDIGHIKVADESDIILVAPATADTIARVAHGRADDAVTCTILATKSPIVMAPAMNVNMWTNPLTQENVAKLKGHGIQFVEPAEGELACGWQGKGRLAEIPEIVRATEQALRHAAPRPRRGAETVFV